MGVSPLLNNFILAYSQSPQFNGFAELFQLKHKIAEKSEMLGYLRGHAHAPGMLLIHEIFIWK